MDVNMNNLEKVINVRDTEFPEDSIDFQFYRDGDVVITMLDDQDSVFTVVVKKDKLFKALGVKEGE